MSYIYHPFYSPYMNYYNQHIINSEVQASEGAGVAQWYSTGLRLDDRGFESW
jgi:hypothetical protein